MKGTRLTALARLTDKRAERERQRLERARDEHRRLERQRHELGEHARRCQNEPMASGRDIAAPLLVQRRGFVEQLTRRVMALGEESRQSEQRMREVAAACRTAMARDTALNALRRRVAVDESRAASREEQKQMDEAARSLPRRSAVASRPDITSDQHGERS